MTIDTKQWNQKFKKIWTLFDAGGDQRIQAFSLLDALLDMVVDAGQGHRLDKIFDGIAITSDGLTIPKFIHGELAAIKVSRWNKSLLEKALKNCRLIEIYELYFRMYPEKIQELPPFLCLEACTHVPNFCGPNSPVRALGLLPPFYDVKGIEKYSNIERVHFYPSVPTFIRYRGLNTFIRRIHFRVSNEVIQQAAELCCGIPHVRHVFTDYVSISVTSTRDLLSTNLVSKDIGTNTLEYAVTPRTLRRDPLLESVTQEIDGQRQVVVDATGITNGNVQEYPHLVVATNFLDHLSEFLSHKTTTCFLEIKRGVKVYNSIVIERVSIFLDENIEAPVSERIIAIEAENASADIQKLLRQAIATLSKCKQITLDGTSHHYQHRLDMDIELTGAMLTRFPSLEVLSVKGHGWGHKGSLKIFPDIWSLKHPLRVVELDLGQNSVGIGFDITTRTLGERLMTWQDTEKNILAHSEHISAVRHLNILNSKDIAGLIPYIPNIKSLVTYPRTLDLSAVTRNPLKFLDHQRRTHFDDVYKYRPTSILSVQSLSDLKLVAERKKIAHRAVLNRKPKVSATLHAEIEKGMMLNLPKMSEQLDVLSGNTGVLKLGRKIYLRFEEGWVRRNHIRIDEGYTKHTKTSQWLNLDLAYKVRAFSIETLPKASKVRLNTSRVSLNDLAACDWIRSLRVDRSLSEEEWSALGKMQNLETFYVSNLGFETMESIYPEVFTLKNLRELYLPNQDISLISEDIKSLVNLEKLSLRGNPIEVEEQAVLFTYLETLPKFIKLYFDADGTPTTGFTIA